jgi:hypothetical protein
MRVIKLEKKGQIETMGSSWIWVIYIAIGVIIVGILAAHLLGLF